MQKNEINKLKKEIENILSDNKAVEIASINLKGKTSIADFMIVASGNSSRHIQALSEILVNELKKKGLIKIKNFKKNPNKLNYFYVLTPQGISEKTKLTLNFMKAKMLEYDELKKELKDKY